MYQLTLTPGIIQRLEDGAFFPSDPGNRDFIGYSNWLADGNTPLPAPAPPDWRVAAISDLNILRWKLMGILTAMQTDYVENGDNVDATVCWSVKVALKTIETSPEVLAVYTNSSATRDMYDAAVKAKWTSLVAGASSQLRSDFVKYGGNTT